jgi:ribonuclease R
MNTNSNSNPKTTDTQNRITLQNIARRVMLTRGLLPEFSSQAVSELATIQAPAKVSQATKARDLRALLWASIDNDDSEDLDQLTFAEAMPEGKTKILVAVADVDALVKKNSAIDQDASHNTTSIYTAAQIFPMLPAKLSTNLTSLNLNEDRLAMVVEMTILPDGSLLDSDVYRAAVRNHAKLAYNSVGAWLEGKTPVPEAVAAKEGLRARSAWRPLRPSRYSRATKSAICRWRKRTGPRRSSKTS